MTFPFLKESSIPSIFASHSHEDKTQDRKQVLFQNMKTQDNFRRDASNCNSKLIHIDSYTS